MSLRPHIQERKLFAAHVCRSCGHHSEREEPDGVPPSSGVFHCSLCGHPSRLNIEIREAPDPGSSS
jgi:rubrerythrin